MAKTWTVKEAFDAIKNNDVNGMADFGKRFPLATAALAKVVATSGENAEMLFGAMPERVTMRVLDAELKNGVTADGDDGEEEEKPVKKAKAEKAEKTEKKAPTKKGRPVKKVEPVEEEEDEEDAEEETSEDESVDYSSMGAVELFKLCKKRGIKVEPKQKASVYVKALKAADAEAEEDDEEEEEKPAKKSGKATTKATAKKSAKKEEEADEDDDWDI